MKQKTTFDDIAKQAHVSKSAVSKAFSNASDISDETRREIFLAAEKLAYVPGRRKKLPRVGFLVQNTDYQNESDFGMQILNSFRSAATFAGYETLLLNFDSDKQTTQKLATFLTRNDLNGAFLVGLDSEHIYAEELQTANVPVVTLDNFIPNPHTAGIGVDSIEGMNQIVQHLIGLGHRRIAFLNGNPCSHVSYDRLKGFILGHALGGLTYDPALTRFGDYVFDIPFADAEFVVNSDATAVVCGCDRIAIGLMRHLKSLHVRVPQDLSVTGFDNIGFAQYVSPELTTVNQDRTALGEGAFGLLKALMEGASGVKLLLHPVLIVRASTAPPQSVKP